MHESLKLTAWAVLWTSVLSPNLLAQGMAQGSAPPTGLKVRKCQNHAIPQLDDITAKAGIKFDHVASRQAKYLPESMSGGVLLIDYDRDGWPDIYFTNAPTLEMASKGERARSALYHNDRDGTFSEVTEKAGIATPCWAMGGAVGDYNNDGWPDIYVTCLGGNVLYRNNGDGTFTDVTAKAGVADGRWSIQFRPITQALALCPLRASRECSSQTNVQETNKRERFRSPQELPIQIR